MPVLAEVNSDRSIEQYDDDYGCDEEQTANSWAGYWVFIFR